MKRKGVKVLIFLLIILLVPGIVGVAAYGVLRVKGEKSLADQATSVVPDLPAVIHSVKDINEVVSEDTVHDNAIPVDEKAQESVTVNESVSLDVGQVIYEGKKYMYNNDIRSFAFMGIDKDGNQTPLIMVGVMNPHNNKIKFIVVNRNTLVGDNEQIRYQYKNGNGEVDSCERVVTAVDEMMHMIPIHGYFGIDMKAILTINDAVGGQEISSLDEIMDNGSYKSFMTDLMKKIVAKTKENKSFPIELYKQVSDYSVTNVSIDKMTYLVSKAVGLDLGNSELLNVPGIIDHDKFFVDEDQLYKLIIEVFYEPVN